MRWDANVHQDILLCLFQQVTLSQPDWGKLMDGLHAMGYTFTEGALRYEFDLSVSFPGFSLLFARVNQVMFVPPGIYPQLAPTIPFFHPFFNST